MREFKRLYWSNAWGRWCESTPERQADGTKESPFEDNVDAVVTRLATLGWEPFMATESSVWLRRDLP